ncbi:hypothetical protein [Lysobacter gummosus]
MPRFCGNAALPRGRDRGGRGRCPNPGLIGYSRFCRASLLWRML